MKNGQTILFLHGWGKGKSAQVYYRETVKKFQEKGYSVYVPDMPGFGEAVIPKKPLTLHDYSEFLRTFIKEKNIKAPILIGHSFGGRVVIKYVSESATDVRAIILCGTPGYRPVKQTKWIVFVGISKIGKLIFSLPGLSNIADQVRGWFYYVIGARDFYRAEGAMRQTFKNIVAEPLKDYMKRIHIPTLLIWGEHDGIVPAQIGMQMKETISHAQFIIIPQSGHSVIVEKPKIFVQSVISFLQSI